MKYRDFPSFSTPKSMEKDQISRKCRNIQEIERRQIDNLLRDMTEAFRLRYGGLVHNSMQIICTN